MSITYPFFPEPSADDTRPGLRRESTWDFLRRSTWSRAREIRAFYNEALRELPDQSRFPILAALKAGHTQSALLEIVVGRFLQLRGALTLDHEPESRGRHVDWRATFPDGTLHVEAMVPIYNAEAGMTARRQARLLDAIEARIPGGWWVAPLRLPTTPENSSLADFKTHVDRLLSALPDARSVPHGEVFRLHPPDRDGVLELVAIRARKGGGLGSGATIGYRDNSQQVLRAAWANRRKRKQGRSVDPPALLAMAGDFLGADLDDFESALFGRNAGRGHTRDGAMLEDDPPWAGVLAFPSVSPAGAPDPVVFVAPAYRGSFPSAIRRLETRQLHPVDGCTIQGAQDHDVLRGIRWALHVR